MKSLLSWFVVIVSIAVLVSSCAKSDDSKTANETETETTTPGSGVFVAVGSNGRIIRSTDNGTNWECEFSRCRYSLSGSIFGNNTFVAVGSTGTVVRSTDNGLTWDNATSPIPYYLRSVTYL